jgi:hypothetical protein
MPAKGITVVGTTGTKRFIKRFRLVTASITGAAQAAATVSTVTTQTVTGVLVGDQAFAAAQTAQPATLAFTAVVTAADTVKIFATNPTAGGISTNTSLWNIIVERDY